MSWIVLGEQKGRIILVSGMSSPGLLPKGSYITVENGKTKFVLRVDESNQHETYSPSPLVIDMDLASLVQDQKCQNIVYAYRVKDITERTDGYIDYIPPQSLARRSDQEEVDSAMGGFKKGPKVFLATVHASQNQLLKDGSGKPIIAILPEDFFYHQILIYGKTGSGKTVASKYLAQYFVEKLEGAVLAINVKDVDFLKMDKPSKAKNAEVMVEWESLGEKAHGVDNFMVYYPANTSLEPYLGLTPEICKKITLDVRGIEPEALIGLLSGVTDIAAQNLPSIFRSWREKKTQDRDNNNFTFSNFVHYFSNGIDNDYHFDTLNNRGEESEITLHRGTFDNIQRNLDFASDFFDNKDAICIDESDILVRGKMSVVNVTGNKGIQFGSILLRHLLQKIVSAKEEQKTIVPILIIIDEVHQFYNTESSREALGALDRICRTGRSQKIGVIFSSQNPSDIPRGLSTVINTKMFFKSDAAMAKSHGITISNEEMESLKKGFAAANVHDLSQLKILKFPLAFSGVFE